MVEESQDAIARGGKTTMQLSLRMPEPKAGSEWEIVCETADLPTEVQQRVEVIQQLIAVRGTKHYAKVQQQAAQRLGISVRSLRRLVKSWQEYGIVGLSRQMRSDQGAIKISSDWQKFIIKTYREGNRGSQRMSRAQVAVRVRVRAQQLGDENYPSRTRPYIEYCVPNWRSNSNRNAQSDGGAIA